MDEFHYLDTLKEVLKDGMDSTDRTGTGKKTCTGVSMKFDLRKGFPAITTKKLAFKAVVGELIGFIQGVNNYKDFNKLGCKVWDANGEADYWLSNPNHSGEEGDLGRIYGVQWSSWISPDGSVINQLSDTIERIKTDPNSRRHIVTAWNPGELDQMALPPCHVMFQFHVMGDRLDLTMYQRSADLFLGSPFNIASYAVLLEMVASLTGYKAGMFNYMIGDAHIYHNHIEQVKTQLMNLPFDPPTLKFTKRETIYDFTVDDFELVNYSHHEPIKAPMAV